MPVLCQSSMVAAGVESLVLSSRSILESHGQPYPQRQGVGNTQRPPTLTATPIVGPSTECPLSEMQDPSVRSNFLRSDADPPHQYSMSWSTQHDCQSPSGHKLHPSVRNSFSGTSDEFPRRFRHRSLATLGSGPSYSSNTSG